MENFEPAVRMLIEDLETLRIISDPLRSQIYEILLPQPGNVRQIAERLGLAPSRLYYHINLMEKAGLVRVVETRMISNMVEKIYRAVAVELEVAPDLLNFANQTHEGKQAITEMLVGALDTTREDLLRSMQARLFDLSQGAAAKPRSVMISRTTARIPDAYAEEFQARLKALIDEFTAKDLEAEQSSGPVQNFALLVALYPSFYYREESGGASERKETNSDSQG